MQKEKIFCIGFGKTGTTTLGHTLKTLGYNHLEGPVRSGLIWYSLNLMDNLWKLIRNHDSFDDFPYPFLYKELHLKYPNAKFILTERSNSAEWLLSLQKHNLRNGPTDANYLAYGCFEPFGQTERLIEL